MSTPESKRMVTCSFCNEDKPATEIGEHLMQCGNKTEQCPNCEKYIRRAVFTYHYENSCANLDELDGDVNRPADQHNNTSTTPKHSPSNSSPVEQNKTITFIPVNSSSRSIQEPTTTASTREIPVKVTYKCEYCGSNCDSKDKTIHRENCLQNPENRKNKQNYGIHALTERNPNQPIANETVECEICNRRIALQDFNAHEDICLAREMNEAQNDGRFRVVNQGELLCCRYCNRPQSVLSLSFHENICRKNKNYANDEAYIGAFCRPAPYYSDDKLHY